MKKTLLLLMAIALIYSCRNEGEKENPSDPNVLVIKQMKEESVRKDSAIISFMQSLNEIEENLATVKEKQKIVTVNSKDVELQKSQPERIVEDITSISALLDKNRKAIAGLSSKLKKANIKIDEMEKMIARMSSQLEEKDAEIISLKEELEKRNVALKTLFNEYNDRVKELGDQEKVINTGYFAFGTMKELQRKKVVSKEGGFVGIGRNSKLADNFNRDYFTKVDISETKEIPLAAKKAKILTNHPAASYKIEGEGKADKLIILDPKEFWSVSKYLVIVVE